MDWQEVDRIIMMALREDIGVGDITSMAVIDENVQTAMAFVPREQIVACGLPVLARLFEKVQPRVMHDVLVEEGAIISTGEQIMLVRGAAQALLSVERVALNLLQHMCGIAMLTARYVKAVEGTGVAILDTRKTSPGLREIDKYAVRVGGGQNHRMRLDDGILIKDNHIEIAGGVAAALHAAARIQSLEFSEDAGNSEESGLVSPPFSVPEALKPIEEDSSPEQGKFNKLQIECDTLTQLEEAIAGGADSVLLDNMDIPTLNQAVELSNGKVFLEASGGVTLENVRAIAETGVDAISIGALTHSAPNADIGLDILRE